MKQFKLFTIALLCLFMFAIVPQMVAAADFDIDRVEVDDNLASTVYVKRGETVTVEVWYHADTDVENLRVKAWITGYDYDEIEAVSSEFDLPANVSDKMTLRLHIPDDIDVNEDYKLHVEMYNDDDEATWNTYKLYIDEFEHDLRVQDVIFTPGLSLEAGDLFFSVVRLENMGEEKEEDIKVTMSIPELGLTTRTYVDELVPEDEDDDEDESSMSSDELFLRLPRNARAGTYDVLIEVEYDRGHEVIEKTYSLVLEGSEFVEQEVSITVDTEAQGINQGAGAVYKVMFANIGSSSADYILGVSGVNAWGTFRVDPAKVTVGEGETAEMFVYVTANEDATVGEHEFVVNVKANGENVKSFTLTADVAKDGANWTGVRRGLEIGFAVLLIILVILGIVLAARKLGGNKEEGIEEPTIEEGQTYY